MAQIDAFFKLMHEQGASDLHMMAGQQPLLRIRGDIEAVKYKVLENDELKKFNVILANPPYSIKSWDRKSFENDPFGRNIWGTPPQGCEQ